MKPEKDNTFCYYPFYQIALKKWDDSGFIDAAPCCNAIRPENDDPLDLNNKLKKLTHDDVFNSDIMKEVRSNMLRGERHTACTTCWKMEDKGMPSYRLHSDVDYEITTDHLHNPRLTCIDFSFGDNCNLRCRMCQPGLSNKLRIDYKYFLKNNLDSSGIDGFELDVDNDHRKKWKEKGSEHKVISWPTKSMQWDYILDNVDKLTQIKAAGGETTITEPFLQFINKCIEVDHAKNMNLHFHTNATKFTDDLLDKLIQFKGLDLNFSIDSFGKNYEYIRYPMKWEALDKSIRNFFEKTKNEPIKVKIQFTNVLSSLNAFNIYELYDYWKQINRDYSHIKLSFWIDFIWPEKKFINVKFLSKELKEELIEHYSTIFIDYEYPIKHIIQYLKNNLNLEITSEDRKNMLREIVIFDQVRNQNYRDYLDPRICNFLEKG